MNNVDKCPNCGAPIQGDYLGQYKCEYCGTSFNKPVSIEVCPDGTQQVRVIYRVGYSEQLMLRTNPKFREVLEPALRRELADRLADQLIDHMIFRELVHFDSQEKDLIGELRVKLLSPDEKKLQTLGLHDMITRWSGGR